MSLRFKLAVLILFFGPALPTFGDGMKESGDIDIQVFESAVEVFQNSEKSKDEKSKAVESSLQLLADKPEYPCRHYWRAVFLTFQCELKDQGRMIPFCILGHLNEIKSALRFAHENYPEHYHYAPARTLAIMYYKMPGFVGGSEKKAREYIKEAFHGAPTFKENILWNERIR